MARLTLNVTIDRPIGYDHEGTIYPINYGYVAGVMGGDGEEQDA
ncbi:MAG: inorganic pyrophosphatase, partial [Lactococcus raffinolactis]